jgi:hypothetical protein
VSRQSDGITQMHDLRRSHSTVFPENYAGGSLRGKNRGIYGTQIPSG